MNNYKNTILSRLSNQEEINIFKALSHSLIEGVTLKPGSIKPDAELPVAPDNEEIIFSQVCTFSRPKFYKADPNFTKNTKSEVNVNGLKELVGSLIYIDTTSFNILLRKLLNTHVSNWDEFVYNQLKKNLDVYIIVNDSTYKIFRTQKGLRLTTFRENIDRKPDLSEWSGSMHFYSYTDFFSILKNEQIIDHRSIFIFQNLRWEFVKLLFRHSGYNLTGGSHNLRHLLSPNYLRFSNFYFNLIFLLGHVYKFNLDIYKMYLNTENTIELDPNSNKTINDLRNEMVRRSYFNRPSKNFYSPTYLINLWLYLINTFYVINTDKKSDKDLNEFISQYLDISVSDDFELTISFNQEGKKLINEIILEV